MTVINQIRELIEKLNEASDAYYNNDEPIMTDFEYDRLYDELFMLEKKSGIVLSNSPTQKVGFDVKSSLEKVPHTSRMLSLDKTKEVSKLISFLGDQKGILSWKLDGLSIMLTYLNGELVKAVTRGNGEIGEDITHNAKFFSNVPLKIAYKERIVVRGEALIPFSEFTRINNELTDDVQFKNPRNLTSGTVRQLDSKVAAKRNVMFYALKIEEDEGIEFNDSKLMKLQFLQNSGFDVVAYEEVTANNLASVVEGFKKKIEDNDFASDGLVLTFDGINYSKILGETSKFPRDSIAFKWADETQITRVCQVQWNTSRTGLINPVAVFEPVELEGTTVTKASVHNVSIIEELELGIGDEVKVYKANMIIPQIAENITRSNNLTIPDKCPECGGETEVRKLREQKALYCTNPNCRAQIIRMLAHYTSRDAMNIEGLSISTLGKFVDCGFIENYVDIYFLDRFATQIVELDGFGEKSYKNIIAAIEKSKDVELHNFINALSINNVGLANAKLLAKHFSYDLQRIISADEQELLAIDGFGETIAHNIACYFKNETNMELFLRACAEVRIKKTAAKPDESALLQGKQFVITGDLKLYNNRNEMQQEIERLGGKVTASVTKKTTFLINNDIDSSSSKNKKAKNLGIDIITEKQFVDNFVTPL